jgi:hypothetical protein
MCLEQCPRRNKGAVSILTSRIREGQHLYESQAVYQRNKTSLIGWWCPGRRPVFMVVTTQVNPSEHDNFETVKLHWNALEGFMLRTCGWMGSAPTLYSRYLGFSSPQGDCLSSPRPQSKHETTWNCGLLGYDAVRSVVSLEETFASIFWVQSVLKVAYLHT